MIVSVATLSAENKPNTTYDAKCGIEINRRAFYGCVCRGMLGGNYIARIQNLCLIPGDAR